MLASVNPKVFYVDLKEGIEFFVGDLRFEVLERDESMALVARDKAGGRLIQASASAVIDTPRLEINTDDINAIYREIAAHVPHLLHPNFPITKKPWGAMEFMIQKKSIVHATFREWPKSGEI